MIGRSRPTRRGLALLAALALAGGVAAGCTEDSGSVEAFCRQVKRVPSLDEVLRGYTTLEARELQKRLDEASDGYRSLADDAPSDVRDDVERIDDLVEVVIQAVADHPDDPSAVAKQVEAKAGQASTRQAALSAARVAAYAKRECQVDLNPVNTTTS